MIWVLMDGDEEIGFHYDIKELLKACETLKPKHEFRITFHCDNIDDTKIDEVISCSETKGEKNEAK